MDITWLTCFSRWSMCFKRWSISLPRAETSAVRAVSRRACFSTKSYNTTKTSQGCKPRKSWKSMSLDILCQTSWCSFGKKEMSRYTKRNVLCSNVVIAGDISSFVFGEFSALSHHKKLYITESEFYSKIIVFSPSWYWGRVGFFPWSWVHSDSSLSERSGSSGAA